MSDYITDTSTNSGNTSSVNQDDALNASDTALGRDRKPPIEGITHRSGGAEETFGTDGGFAWQSEDGHSAARPMTPPSASISRTRCPLPMPPIAGSQLICPSVSMSCVSRSVRAPMRAAAS